MPKLDFKQIAVRVGGLAAGGIGAGFIAKYMPATIDQKIVSIAQIGAGVFVPELLGKKAGKNKALLMAFGDGMIAVGAQNLAKQFIPAIAGINETYVGAGKSYEEERIVVDGISESHVGDDEVSGDEIFGDEEVSGDEIFGDEE